MAILIVEDEPKTARHLQAGLEAAGFRVQSVGTAEAGLSLATVQPFEAMVVDVMLPGRSGLDMVRQLRSTGIQAPVLFLSAKSTLEDRIKGLEEGGDDYLGKPYAIPEVIARIRALLRRSQTGASATQVTMADLLWEPEQKRISRMGHRVDLTPKEYDLACLLLQHRGEVVPRSLIVQALWGDEVPAASNVVDVQMLRLRKKLDDPFDVKLLHTLRGVGVVMEYRADRP